MSVYLGAILDDCEFAEALQAAWRRQQGRPVDEAAEALRDEEYQALLHSTESRFRLLLEVEDDEQWHALLTEELAPKFSVGAYIGALTWFLLDAAQVLNYGEAVVAALCEKFSESVANGDTGSESLAAVSQLLDDGLPDRAPFDRLVVVAAAAVQQTLRLGGLRSDAGRERGQVLHQQAIKMLLER